LFKNHEAKNLSQTALSKDQKSVIQRDNEPISSDHGRRKNVLLPLDYAAGGRMLSKRNAIQTVRTFHMAKDEKKSVE